MFWRLLLESFVRQRRRKALAGIAILLGTTAVTAMLALATTIGDRIHRELAVFGANIIVTPAADALSVKIGGVDLKPAGTAYLHEKDLDKLKTIFWANNITGLSPELSRPGTMYMPTAGERGQITAAGFWREHGSNGLDGPHEKVPVVAVGYWFNHNFGALKTGAPQLHPWWRLEGRWPSETSPKSVHEEDAVEIVLGSQLAQKLGINVGGWVLLGKAEGQVVGIVTTGDATENEILYPLEAVIIPPPVAPGAVVSPIPDVLLSRVEVSAQTKPEDAFARKDPDTLTPKLREVWYCRPYANSIAYQIREAIPGAAAEQVRQVEQSEGNVLERIGGLMWLISAAALLAAGFAVSAAMATAVLERRSEIGLMRSLGASKGAIALLFYAETGLLALVAGSIGYLAGSGLAAWLGARIFESHSTTPIHTATFNPVLLPVVVGLGLVVAIAGSTPSIRAALRMNPSAILREDG